MLREVAAVHHLGGAVHVPLHHVAAEGSPMRSAGSRLTSAPPRSALRVRPRERLGRELDQNLIRSPLGHRQADARNRKAVADRQPLRQPGAHPHGEAHSALAQGTGSAISLPRSTMRPENKIESFLVLHARVRDSRAENRSSIDERPDQQGSPAPAA